jgi:N,N-dimethylformamidase
MPSGVHWVCVDNGEGSDTIPFYVTVAPGAKRAQIALLARTVTYLADANNARDSVQGAPAARVREWGAYLTIRISADSHLSPLHKTSSI